MKKPYENSSPYDPGRFRYALTFFQRVITEDEAGDQTESWTQVLQCRAIRVAIPKRANFDGNIQVNAGVMELLEMWNFVIRFRRDFLPAKDMAVVCGSDIYTVRTVSEVDEPANYYKVLCVKTDLNLTT